MFDVAVIGLGAMGASTAWHLASRDIRVLGIDQFTPPHTMGSSHGLSRAIRTAYFEDPCYVPLVQAATAEWRRLEQETGTGLLDMTGVLLMGPAQGELIAGAQRSCKAHGLRHDMISRNDIMQRWPVFQPAQGDVGLYETDGGYLRPEAAISAFLQAARSNGAELRCAEPVLAVAPGADSVTVTTGQGIYQARRAIIAAGAWAGRFVPELAATARTTRQVLAWFAPVDAAAVTRERLPVFAADTPGGAFYGFPMLDEQGVKIAKHGHQGEIIDPAAPRRGGDGADEAILRVFAERYMPGVLGPLRKMATCIYTELPQDFFLLDRLPGAANVTIVSACSGHGFKFASIIGKIAADLALEGRTDFNIAPFSFEALADRRW